MNDINIQLTYVDRMILQSYHQILDGFSNYLGDGYEIVLHSLDDYSHSAIKVINGFHTGRKEGAPITDLALNMLDKIQTQGEDCLDITYFSHNKNGEPLKSTTIAIQGENQRIIGLLCINFYLNTPLSQFLNGFTNADSSPFTGSESLETFSSNSQELVEEIVMQVRQEVFNDAAISSNKKNKEIILRLYKRGVYNMKDAVIRTSQLLNMSKNTVYLHLRNLTKNN